MSQTAKAIPVVIACPICGYEGEGGDEGVSQCPQCGSWQTDVTVANQPISAR